MALLAHLYKNRLSFVGLGESQLYDLVINISTHNVTKTNKKSRYAIDRPIPDDEVNAVAKWIQDNARSILKGERQITYRHLQHILEHFRFRLDNPKGNSIDIYKLVETTEKK